METLVNIESELVNNDVADARTETAETLNLGDETPDQKLKFLRLPLSRVKTIMKKDPVCGLLSQDAVLLVTKATEMFIEYLSKELGKQLVSTGKRKTLMKKDVDFIISNCPQLCFLDGALH